jgi:hypothetical protein
MPGGYEIIEETGEIADISKRPAKGGGAVSAIPEQKPDTGSMRLPQRARQT